VRLTFVQLRDYRDDGASRAVAGIDDEGNRQVLAVEWIAELVPLVGARFSVYPLDGSCLAQEQCALVVAFVKARLNNRLPLVGAALEV
jgi:hypothetical protein